VSRPFQAAQVSFELSSERSVDERRMSSGRGADERRMSGRRAADERRTIRRPNSSAFGINNFGMKIGSDGNSNRKSAF
jgi:hypothetical protein